MSMTAEQLAVAVKEVEQHGTERERRILAMVTKDSADLKDLEWGGISMQPLALVGLLRTTAKLRRLLKGAHSYIDSPDSMTEDDLDGLMAQIENTLFR